MARYTTDDLEKFAWRLREKLSLTGVARLDGHTLLQAMKKEYRDFEFRRVPCSTLPHAEAEYQSDPPTIFVTEQLYCALSDFHTDSVRRARALNTLAHEIAHFVLGHKGVLNRRTHAAAHERAVPRIRRYEAEATAFAPRFLAPLRLIHPSWPPQFISEKFGISFESARYRWEERQREHRKETGQDRPLPSCVTDLLDELKRNCK